MSITEGPWPNSDKRQRTITPFEPFSPAEWQGIDPPAYDWLVDGCVLKGTVAMLSGDGGLGKRLLMQQLLTAASIGQPWLGLSTKQVKTFGVFCEDDKAELHRRQAAIDRHYGCSPGDLENVLYTSRVGMESIIMDFNRNNDTPKPTPVFDQLRHAVLEFGAQLLVLDTVADVFGGNEIVRGQVRRFITALRRLAVEMQGAVILTAHPSNLGMSEGSGLSGSRAWNNSVRSRLYLTARRADEDEAEAAPERFLRTMKNNHGPWGGKIGLRWGHGVFVRADGGIAPTNAVDRTALENQLIAALAELLDNGTMVPAAHQSRNGFVNVMRTLPPFKTVTQGTLIGVQERLIKEGRLVRVELGPKSKRFIYLRPADRRYPGEEGGGTLL